MIGSSESVEKKKINLHVFEIEVPSRHILEICLFFTLSPAPQTNHTMSDLIS